MSDGATGKRLIVRKPQIEFTLIPHEKIPGHLPVTPIASDRKGSQWDDALNALKRHGDTHGIRVPAANKAERIKFKSTLTTIAKTHAMPVTVLDDKKSCGFFAWISDREGRFTGPRGRGKY